MTKEFYTELCHSAKGTSWKKKDHKYLKLIDGRYYYATEKQIRDIKRTNERLETEKANLADESSAYDRDTRNASRLTKSAKREYRKAIEDNDSKWKQPFAKSHMENYKGASAKARKLRETAAAHKKEVDRLVKNISSKETRLNELTVSYQVKSWVNNLFSKFKK